MQDTFIPAPGRVDRPLRAAGRHVAGFGAGHGLELDLESLIVGREGGAKHPPLAPDHPIVVSCTSGSTGTSTGAVLTQHGGWTRLLFSSPYTGGRVTTTSVVPTMLNAIERVARERDVDLPSVRLIITLGSPLVPAVLERARCGCEFQNWYASNEVNGAIAMLRPADIDPNDPADAHLYGSVGLPLPHVDV